MKKKKKHNEENDIKRINTKERLSSYRSSNSIRKPFFSVNSLYFIFFIRFFLFFIHFEEYCLKIDTKYHFEICILSFRILNFFQCSNYSDHTASNDTDPSFA
jgi:hypothetical protein